MRTRVNRSRPLKLYVYLFMSKLLRLVGQKGAKINGRPAIQSPAHTVQQLTKLAAALHTIDCSRTQMLGHLENAGAAVSYSRPRHPDSDAGGRGEAHWLMCLQRDLAMRSWTASLSRWSIALD